tara:strand:- start:551 stop:766 length:216 start_codon:yes stop_codon:yes gene_type:complete
MPVSEPEKNADISTRNAIERRRIQRGISLNLKCPVKDLGCMNNIQLIKIKFSGLHYNHLLPTHSNKDINFP